MRRAAKGGGTLPNRPAAESSPFPFFKAKYTAAV